MEKRKLGKTGLEVSLFGFGGFHLLETTLDDANKLLNRYLDAGGNYIETAAGYGNGKSEKKIGESVSHRRDEYILASKSGKRTKDLFIEDVNQSIKNLKTSFLDVIFLHGVGSMDELNTIFSENGAYEGFVQLKKEGKVRHLGISMHGQPDVLIEAVKNHPVEIVMTTVNYYDRYNFPKIEEELLPLCNENEKGIVLMKPIADGYLYRSVENAFNYAFSRNVSVVVSGANTMEMLNEDIRLANEFSLTSSDVEKLDSDIKQNAIELTDYVCRRCGLCNVCPEGIDIMEIFKLEGWFDRQMNNMKVDNPALYALKERLRFWFRNNERAMLEYSKLEHKFDECTNCQKCVDICPYGIDILKKLAIADYKLTGKEIL